MTHAHSVLTPSQDGQEQPSQHVHAPHERQLPAPLQPAPPAATASKHSEGPPLGHHLHKGVGPVVVGVLLEGPLGAEVEVLRHVDWSNDE